MKQKRLKDTEVCEKSLYVKPKKPIKKQKFLPEHAKATWLTPKKEQGGGEGGGEGGEGQGGEGQGEGEGSSSYKIECQHDEEFEMYLESHSKSSERYDLGAYAIIALEYLKQGPPYKGVHLKDYKTSLKERGAKWMKNPDHVPGTWDPTQKFGWYVCTCIKDLKSVLTLPLTYNGERAWYPDVVNADDDEDGGSSSNTICMHVLELIDQFEDSKKRKLEAERIAHLAAKNAKDAKLKQAAMGTVWEDSEEDIKRLVEKLSTETTTWTYDANLIRSSATSDRLGPAMTSNAKRVLRALHLKILTREDVLKGDFHGFDVREINKQRMRRERASAALGKSKVGSSSNSKMMETKNEEERERNISVGKLSQKEEERRLTNTNYLRTDSQMEEMQRIEQDSVEMEEMDTLQEEGGGVVSSTAQSLDFIQHLKPTRCLACKLCVDDQFDCDCLGVRWTKCHSCFLAKSLMQQCLCCGGCMDVVYTVEVADKEEEEEEDGGNGGGGEKKMGDDNDSQSETKRGKQKVTSPINVKLGPKSPKNKAMALRDDDDDL